jgi:hypothetical protein
MAETITETSGRLIRNGMAVYDVNGAKIGVVVQVDPTNGWFRSEKGILLVVDMVSSDADGKRVVTHSATSNMEGTEPRHQGVKRGVQ